MAFSSQEDRACEESIRRGVDFYAKDNLWAKRLVCGETGKELVRKRELCRWAFWDYSWICKSCGKTHCSNCSYILRGYTIRVYNCERFT